MLFVIGRSLALGRRGGLLSVLGNALGLVPLVAGVAFGVGTILAESILLFTTVGLVFIALALALDSVWAILTGTARNWFASSPRRLPSSTLRDTCDR